MKSEDAQAVNSLTKYTIFPVSQTCITSLLTYFTWHKEQAVEVTVCVRCLQWQSTDGATYIVDTDEQNNAENEHDDACYELYVDHWYNTCADTLIYIITGIMPAQTYSFISSLVWTHSLISSHTHLHQWYRHTHLHHWYNACSDTLIYIWSSVSFTQVTNTQIWHYQHRSHHWIQWLAATLRGSRPGVQSASLIVTSLMTS